MNFNFPQPDCAPRQSLELPDYDDAMRDFILSESPLIQPNSTA